MSAYGHIAKGGKCMACGLTLKPSHPPERCHEQHAARDFVRRGYLALPSSQAALNALVTAASETKEEQ